MAKQTRKATAKRSSTRKTGSIRAKGSSSAYAARESLGRDPLVDSYIAERVRYGEAMRADIEKRIEARLHAP